MIKGDDMTKKTKKKLTKAKLKDKIIEFVKEGADNRYKLKKKFDEEKIQISYQTIREYVFELILEGKLKFIEEDTLRGTKTLKVVEE